MAITFEDFRNLTDLAIKPKNKNQPTTLFGKILSIEDELFLLNDYEDDMCFNSGSTTSSSEAGTLRTFTEIETQRRKYNFSIKCSFLELLKAYTENEIKFKLNRICNSYGNESNGRLLEVILIQKLEKALLFYEKFQLPKIKQIIAEYWMEEPTQSPSYQIVLQFMG